MERAIEEMEKIRHAEEISSKRNNQKDENNIKTKSIYKYLFQILLLLNVTIFAVAFQNREYIFSSEFIEQVGNYNINIKSTIEGLLEKSENSEDEEQNDDNENNIKDNNTTDEETGVGGSDENLDNTENNNESEEISQMELDAKNILENYSVILPVQGTKTSGFGLRESTNSIVTKNHTGVDIGATTGTVIVAAHSGTITLVSNEGDYGNHLKITDGDLTTLYAHCSKIYVSEGQEVNQGDNIAEVGSTGNSTGPHLHFEIIYQERYVDPELVIEI